MDKGTGNAGKADPPSFSKPLPHASPPQLSGSLPSSSPHLLPPCQYCYPPLSVPTAVPYIPHQTPLRHFHLCIHHHCHFPYRPRFYRFPAATFRSPPGAPQSQPGELPFVYIASYAAPSTTTPHLIYNPPAFTGSDRSLRPVMFLRCTCPLSSPISGAPHQHNWQRPQDCLLRCVHRPRQRNHRHLLRPSTLCCRLLVQQLRQLVRAVWDGKERPCTGRHEALL
jgi:hypothetical protein